MREYSKVARARRVAGPTPDSKFCGRCKQAKPAADFHRHKRSKDGLQPYCVLCSNLIRREYESRNAEAIALRRAEKLAIRASPDERKTCTRCGVERPLIEFYRHRGTKDGRATHCSECQRARTREWNAANRDRIKQRNAAARLADPERKRRDHRQFWLRAYGLDEEAYQALLVAQNYVCAICQSPETWIDARTGDPRRLAVDHCHKTGKVRGLLCGSCNRGIGQFRDDPSLLKRASVYLQGGTTE